jgi:alpha-N-acetylglucosaminidase
LTNASHSTTRRRFLQQSGGAVLLLASQPSSLHAFSEGAGNIASAASQLLKRVIGPQAKQIHLTLLPEAFVEEFTIRGSIGSAGRIHIEGTSGSALLMGAHWYLRHVAGVSISWNGDSLDRLPAILPAPSAPIHQRAAVRHRFALNDTNDGYTGPYWTWPQWERLLDVLALHGINEVLVYLGAEAVYQQTFQKFHYTAEELRAWFPTPAHQPWWLLQNMSSWVGPSVSQHLIDSRLVLAAKITARLRELGIKPVLPGYYGIVPDGFVEKNPDARIVPQGTWLEMKRPDWLDPTCDVFPKVAEEFYRVQEELMGPSSMFKMDPLHEGGKAGSVNITNAALSIDQQLQKAHPGAIWAILGWQENPKHELLAGIEDKSHALILDGLSDRYDYKDREQEWDNTPYAFGTIWNFGGHTTIGANIGVWNERYFDQLARSGSKLDGIAVMPEAGCNNPAAFAFFTELGWRSQRPDLPQWFAEWSSHRYGGKDANAFRAWDVLRTTAYNMKSGEWSEAHDNLFSARPSLTAKSACSWSPQEPRYDLAAFSAAIGALLKVHPSLRETSAYRYDLADVARQTIANNSRLLLPKIHAAYRAADIPLFRKLTQCWLQQITLLEQVVGTESDFLLGRWLASAKAAAKSSTEQAQLEFDARSILLEWGPEASKISGVHDYANREWHGLLGHYRERWAAYFSMLDSSFEKHEAVHEIDWFAMDQAWARQTNDYPVRPQGDPYAVITEALKIVNSLSHKGC